MGDQVLKQLHDLWRKVAASPHAETVSGKTVARFLGVTTSAINRLAVSPALPESRKYLKALQNLRPLFRPLFEVILLIAPFFVC